jgi:hypothetical protein
MLLRVREPVTLRDWWTHRLSGPGTPTRVALTWRIVTRSIGGALPSPKATPFTFGYLVVLLGTTLVLRFADPVVTAKLLQLSSTDAHNLWRRPLTSLLASALWLADGGWLAYAIIFTIAIAPLERRFGPGRTALVFFSGHVLATLVTEVPVMVLISGGLLPTTAGRWLDIGVSYGFFTTLGALVFLLRGRARIVALVAMELFITTVWLSDSPETLDSVVTVIGHLCAAHFGFFYWGARLNRPPAPALT